MGDKQLVEGKRQEVFTVKEVAAMLKMSKQTVLRAIHKGELEALQIGSAFRIPGDAFDRWQNSLTYSPKWRPVKASNGVSRLRKASHTFAPLPV